MRADGTLLCGAKSEPMEGDRYLDDALHYILAVEQRVLIPDDDEAITGRWHWRGEREAGQERALVEAALRVDNGGRYLFLDAKAAPATGWCVFCEGMVRNGSVYHNRGCAIVALGAALWPYREASIAAAVASGNEHHLGEGGQQP
jgi:hypothetical protein